MVAGRRHTVSQMSGGDQANYGLERRSSASDVYEKYMMDGRTAPKFMPQTHYRTLGAKQMEQDFLKPADSESGSMTIERHLTK